VEHVKTELSAFNPINQKRKRIQRGDPNESVNQKKPTPAPPKSHPASSAEPCRKCRRTNRTTPECRVRTNKCMWCGSPKHLIAACPRRLKAADKDAAKPLGPLRQGPLPSRVATVGRAFLMNKKEAATSGTVVTGTLFLNSKPFCVLFDSGTTHSFISTQSAIQLSLENRRMETNYTIKLPNDSVVECPLSYKLVPATTGGTTFPVDLIQFDLSDFGIILGMNWLHA